MKKLISILLTLVIAVCLVNLNNRNTKAEDENDDFPIYFGKNGTNYKVCADQACNTEYNGAYKNYISVPNASEPIFVIDGLNMTTTGGKSAIIVAESITIKFKGSNSISATGGTPWGNPTLKSIDGKNITITAYDGGNNSLTLDSTVYNDAAILIDNATLTFDEGTVIVKKI